MARVGLLSLLGGLYSKVVVPPKVYDELQISLLRPGFEALAAAFQEAWMTVEAPRPTTDLDELKEVLGDGEAEAIVLAQQQDARLLIDEKRGRSVASSRGLKIVGTGAVLLLAKERGLIDRVGDTLDQLASHSYRLSAGLRARILELAGEA
ncbi:MAG TPA: DUF3368 domain-containing protein [Thermoanaerobaculia bacterium]|nr:DUF3368 domain-containing protein [Thermoanaerobaculia bacterium]